MKLTDEQRRLVEEHMWTVAFVVNRLRSIATASQLDFDDARQIGFEAMSIAALRFTPEVGKFSTYAIAYIRGAILTACRENSLIRVPSTTLRLHPEQRVRVSYLSAPISGEGEDAITLEDALPDSKDTESRCIVTGLWEQFNSREQIIIERRLQGCSQKEAGQAVGLSQAHVSRCMQSAQRKAERYLALCEA